MNNEEFHKQLEYMKQQRDENTPKAISISEFQKKLFNKMFDAYISDDEIYNIIRDVYRDELNHYVENDRIYLKFHILYDYIVKEAPYHGHPEYEVRMESITFYIQGAGADRLYHSFKMPDIVLFSYDDTVKEQLSITGERELNHAICFNKLPLFIYETDIETEKEDDNRFHTTYLLYYEMK